MTFEQLQAANATIKTTPIKGKNYAEVNQRIKAFRSIYPNGKIETVLVSLENGMCVFRAEISDDEGRLLGTGTAYEKETSSQINRTSYIEVCETSAVGRALGMCGFGIDTSIASAEELKNALYQQEQQEKEVNFDTTEYISKEQSKTLWKIIQDLYDVDPEDKRKGAEILGKYAGYASLTAIPAAKYEAVKKKLEDGALPWESEPYAYDSDGRQ